MMMLRRLHAAAVLSAALVGCGSSPAVQHAPFPQLEYQMGELLTAPKVVTITFAGDSLASQVQAFGASVTSSAWWNDVRAGYCGDGPNQCLGDGPQGASVMLTTSPASTYTDSDTGGPSSLQAWMATEFANGTFPPPGSDDIYLLYFPVGGGTTPLTTVTLDGMGSCIEGGFDGYHNYLTVNHQPVAYAVIMECAPLPPLFPSVPPIDLLQNTTITTSHEVFEASSDPIPPSGFALDLDYLTNVNNLNNYGWNDIVGTEAADLCVDPLGLEQDETTDGPYTVQRIWSNARAAAGIDPCVPAPAGEAYFNAAPKTAFFVVDVGGSVTFEVDAFSSGPISDWTLIAQDWTEPNPVYLQLSIAGGENTDAGPQIQVHNGSRIEVTATLLADPGSLPTFEADGSIISFSGDPDNPTAAHYWPFAVISTADAADAGLQQVPGRTRVPARGAPHVHRYGSQQRRALARAP